jgi:hypothetical protein
MQRLDQRDWPNKADLGWNNYDLEINGSRWSHLRLLTVREALGTNRQLIRCRLRTVWTLFGTTLFWGLAGLELLLIGFFAPYFPWLWAILLCLPVLVWWFDLQHRNLRRLIGVFLDEVAAELGLIQVQAPCPPKMSAALNEGAVAPSLALKGSD